MSSGSHLAKDELRPSQKASVIAQPMCPRNEVLHAFATWARTIGGSTAAALRRLMSQAIEGTERGEGLHGARPIPVTIAPREVNRDEQVGMHLKASERAALVAAAQA